MKIRRIVRIRHGQTTYRFVDADTGEMQRNSQHPYTHAVVGLLDDDRRMVAFSFHTTQALADKRARATSICIGGVDVVTIEVEPS